MIFEVSFCLKIHALHNFLLILLKFTNNHSRNYEYQVYIIKQLFVFFKNNFCISIETFLEFIINNHYIFRYYTHALHFVDL